MTISTRLSKCAKDEILACLIALAPVIRYLKSMVLGHMGNILVLLVIVIVIFRSNRIPTKTNLFLPLYFIYIIFSCVYFALLNDPPGGG